MKHFITAAMLLFVTGPATAQNFELEKLFPQVQCMALNVYYEARGSNLADKAAVADVVLNRVNDRRYPNTVCEVVKQGKQDSNGNMILNKCQFSWYCDGKHDRPQDADRWAEAQSIAWNIVEENKFRGITEGSTHYHATYVNPRWAKTLQLVGRIGAHIFYRWE
ncbi:cell wall hydrolase [bacterium]|jgi:spore germination cell wall hydrolase CwlJ-like protein|nr:cell wall hydrolase [bacterium]